jgi:hypothetical protein
METEEHVTLVSREPCHAFRPLPFSVIFLEENAATIPIENNTTETKTEARCILIFAKHYCALDSLAASFLILSGRSEKSKA